MSLRNIEKESRTQHFSKPFEITFRNGANGANFELRNEEHIGPFHGHRHRGSASKHTTPIYDIGSGKVVIILLNHVLITHRATGGLTN